MIVNHVRAGAATSGGRRYPGGGWAVDVAAALLATAFMLLATSHIDPTGSNHELDALGYVLICLAGASLALCRRRPDVAVGVVAVVLATYLLRHYVGGPIFVTAWISLFFLSWRSTRRAALIGAVALASVLVLAGLAAGSDALVLHLVFIGWSAAAVFLGEALRNRRSYLTELEDRARYLERSREQEARRRVAEDRLRIARDLHDSVAHAMATINVQAGAAAHVVDRRPAAAKDALTVIQRASAEVLDELAAMLALLRSEGEGEADGPALAPTPGFLQIPALVASMRESHLPVTFEQHGPLDAVPNPVGTAAYRIVQESLTNVMRHGRAAPTAVTVRVEAGDLTIEVTDDGPGTTGTAGTGVGIRGMRERAEATGGTLHAAPRPGRGFTVRASWPIPS